jgi:hypothetical protein
MDATSLKLFNGELCIGCAVYEEATCVGEGYAIYCTACEVIAAEG